MSDKFNEVLGQIQTRLHAPKSQLNKFGGYKYRNLEDIMEAVKPLLSEFKATITLLDEIIMLGDRFYVKATATLKSEGNEPESVTAYAREALIKKGMDEAQITGSASSYARKYALNGLLAIDDTKDADSKDNVSSDTTKTVSFQTPKADNGTKPRKPVEKPENKQAGTPDSIFKVGGKSVTREHYIDVICKYAKDGGYDIGDIITLCNLGIDFPDMTDAEVLTVGKGVAKVLKENKKK